MLTSLLDRLRQGDRLALARLLTLAARGENLTQIRDALRDEQARARVVALTGGGGVGKSSLAGRLLVQIRSTGQRVALLACDPESPISGGALLGDRFRMGPAADDEGVFIRSLAAPGGNSALAEHLDVLIRLLEVFGFEMVLIETVGAGQGDTAIRQMVDVLVLLVQPEAGDEVQWEKAGLFEVADLIVLHKADLPGATRAEAQLRSMLELCKANCPDLLTVSSQSGSGVSALWENIAARPLRRSPAAGPDELYRLLLERLAARFEECKAQDALAVLNTQWHRGELSTADALDALYELLRPIS